MLVERLRPMNDAIVKAGEAEGGKGSWGELFRDGRGLYSSLIIGGIAMHATQILVIAIDTAHAFPVSAAIRT